MQPAVKRYFCIYLPYWSAGLLRKKLERKKINCESPLLLTAALSQQLFIKRFSRDAYKNGIKEGMPLALAKALCPEAHVAPFTPQYDFRALVKLGKRLLSFTPIVAADPDLRKAKLNAELEDCSPVYDGLVLDTTGTDRLHGGEKALAAKILALLDSIGIEAKIGAAPTIGAAWALSRYGRERFQSTLRPKEALSPFPLAALRLPQDLIQALKDVDVRKIGQLLSFPPKALLQRFGYALLRRVDQALGRMDEPLYPLHEQEQFRASQDFSDALSNTASIHRCLLQLVEELNGRLAGRGLRTSAFTFFFDGVKLDCSHFQLRKELTLGVVSFKQSHVSALIHYLLENLRLPGDIYSIAAAASQIETIRQEQGDFVNGAENSRRHAARELLDHLTVRLGGSRVCGTSTRQSYIPEKGFEFHPYREKASKPVPAVPPPGGRPPCLLRPPRPIQAIALMPDHAPAWISWQGRRHVIISGLGPERICGEWWHDGIENAGVRDYFKVQDSNGRWLWIYRDNDTQQWFLQGVWN